jgi:pyruvate formate lyase activating enzyme
MEQGKTRGVQDAPGLQRLKMIIGGLQKMSLIDYPGRIGATVFTQGCNFRCPYCHNPELVDPEQYGPETPEEEVWAFLEKRRNKLEAVIVTGGEPTLQKDLDCFLKRAKEMGYLTKVDTNGSKPEVLERLIRRNLVDYLAMDIKGPIEKYGAIAAAKVDTDRVSKSIDLILTSGIDHEFRTTVIRSQLSHADLLSIAKGIKNARLYALQAFRGRKILDGALLSETSYSPEEFASLRESLEKEVGRVVFR